MCPAEQTRARVPAQMLRATFKHPMHLLSVTKRCSKCVLDTFDKPHPGPLLPTNVTVRQLPLLVVALNAATRQGASRSEEAQTTARTSRVESIVCFSSFYSPSNPQRSSPSMEALMGGMGSQANSAAIQAQKAEERQAEQLQPFYLENIVHNQRQIAK